MIQFITQFDINIINFINQYFSNKPLTLFFNIFTYFGYYAIGWIILFIFISIKKKNKFVWMLWGITFILIWIISDIFLKNIIQRTRPFLLLSDISINTKIPHSYSFPSSHASFSSASYYIINKIEENNYIKIIIFIISILVSLSRLILKVHYFTDVIAGYLLGIFFGMIVNFILNKYYKNKISK